MDATAPKVITWGTYFAVADLCAAVGAVLDGRVSVESLRARLDAVYDAEAKETA